MTKAILKVSGTKIVDGDGNQVILKGAGLGGMLNMENFITGYPGHESEHKAAIARVIGQEKTDFFFEKFYDYFWTEEDAKFFAGLGLNTIRIPFNYRHFMDDQNPGVIKQEGFRLLDRVVERCAKYGIYTVLDLHAVPGGQNQDWHTDSAVHRALFWDFMDFQDRMIQLWEALAEHYKGNPWIAGYNPLNEPADEQHSRLWNFYVRVEKAIRAIDPDHILFLDGNTYSGDFSGFGKPFPNIVYAIHDYSTYGFPGFEQFTAEEHQIGKLQRQFDRKIVEPYAQGVPVWNGEFGPVYEDEHKGDTAAAKTENEKRYAMLRQQLSIYKKADNVSWSIWTYKDVGIQGLVYTSPESAWGKTFGEFIEKKKRLGTDAWGVHPSPETEKIYNELVEHFREEIPERFHKAMYPPIWDLKRQLTRVSREILLSSYLSMEYAELFDGKSEAELDELAASFKIDSCIKRDLLNQYLSEDTK
ncbi:glycoside hydrolase superfamily [Dipodascopsis tothii]|uniref:glycoside hydrolase superfamily n=1 Tax=Dipodascopsis tothii TaxID=44089 RepID=UPI0034CE2F6C